MKARAGFRDEMTEHYSPVSKSGMILLSEYYSLISKSGMFCFLNIIHGLKVQKDFAF